MIGAKVDGLDTLGPELRAGGEAVTQAVERATWEALLLLQREIKELTPTASTLLRQSFLADRPRRAGATVLGRVGSSLAHAAPVEFGTKPHWAPVEPLQDWVRQKFGTTDEGEIERFARRIQFAIAARGTLGVGMVNRTFARYEGWVVDLFRRRIAEARV
jgi:hypothetical protein